MNRYEQARRTMSLTQEEAAVRLGTSPSVVSNIERGKTEPRAETLRRMAHVYHCSTDWLLQVREESMSDV